MPKFAIEQKIANKYFDQKNSRCLDDPSKKNRIENINSEYRKIDRKKI